jgi:hypothetical protein
MVLCVNRSFFGLWESYGFAGPQQWPSVAYDAMILFGPVSTTLIFSTLLLSNFEQSIEDEEVVLSLLGFLSRPHSCWTALMVVVAVLNPCLDLCCLALPRGCAWAKVVCL